MHSARDRSGKRYELLVQEIFRILLNQNEVRTIEVEHDVTLQGNSTTHQIDVYWEFEKGGIKYRTVVQAKDWANPVQQGELIKFKGVLDDLPQQPRGVFVTRTGYQEGAKQFAQAHGIALYELSEEPERPGITMTTLGWATLEPVMRRFGIPATETAPAQEELAMATNATVYQPRFPKVTVEVDTAWFDDDPTTRDIDKSTLRLAELPMSQTILYNGQRQAIGNVESIGRQELEIMRKENFTHKTIAHVFKQPTFLGPTSPGSIYIKINKIVFEVVIEKTYRPGKFKLKTFLQFVLREIPDGETRSFIKPRE